MSKGFFLPTLMGLLAAALFVIRPIMNFLPFDYTQVAAHPFLQFGSFFAMYLVLALPFFLSGLIVITLISTYSHNIQTLYFWDLVGAAIGCIIIVPLLPPIGPGGIIYLASGLALISASLVTGNPAWKTVIFAVSMILIIVPFLHSPKYFDFEEHTSKRG
ncbi:MAG: hypothetical protein GWN01_16345 [Nitrosopumilaceae archaeon]|nr:hypothetical protein [Nitrosopumilaceae archaeon]NIX63007.1 hypothetical protein [Nitrosopumilaceae archaeon]